MTVPALRNALKSLLSRAGVENPDGDAAEILCAALNCSRTELILRDDELSDVESEKAVAMAWRRAAGEPIQYVLGYWFFMDRQYKVGEGVLIPRDDTEVVVREALAIVKAIPEPVIVDLCAGSGIIAVTLAKELQNATVYAVEKSEKAFTYLTDNIELNQSNVMAIRADLQDCVKDFDDGSLDMIVSNPPYIRRDELPALQREVQYEPRLALDGGADGYDFYEMIIRLWTKKLKEGGTIAFEIGEGQYDRIAETLKDAGFTEIQGTKDIQGTVRAITAQKGSLS